MSKITIQEFSELVKENLSKLLSESHPNLTLNIKQVPHPGGIRLTGLTIKKPGSFIAPILYLDDPYKDYCAGADINNILYGLVQTYEECTRKTPKLDYNKLTDWNYCKPHIVGRFVNISRQLGDRYLTTRPVTEIPGTNIGIIYDSDFTNTKQSYSIPVNFSTLETWNITIQELEKTARENLPVLRPVTIDSMNSSIKDILARLTIGQAFTGIEFENTDAMPFPDIQSLTPIPLYLVTNAQNRYGFICITYPGVYEEVCRKLQEDCYILPNSVHECICVPKSCLSPEELLAMVAEINRLKITKGDFLCDDIFEIRDGNLVSAFTPEKRNQILLNNSETLPFC